MTLLKTHLINYSSNQKVQYFHERRILVSTNIVVQALEALICFRLFR